MSRGNEFHSWGKCALKSLQTPEIARIPQAAQSIARLAAFFVLSIVAVPVAGAESAQWEHSIRALDDDRWAVVQARTVRGRIVIVSSDLGMSIDALERDKLRLFQGSISDSKMPQILQTPISGFQSAVFLESDRGQFVIKIIRSQEGVPRHVCLVVGDASDFGKIRSFLSADGIVTEQLTYAGQDSFQDIRRELVLNKRKRAVLDLVDGGSLKGELLPDLEEGRLLLDTSQGLIRLAPSEIAKLCIPDSRTLPVIHEAFRSGFGGFLSGVLIGTAVGLWDTQSSILDHVKTISPLLGAVGFAGGALSQYRDYREYTFPNRAPDGGSLLRIRIPFL